jgi:adenylate cyclase
MHGREEDAQAEIETALRLNPESWEANKEGARVLYRHGKIIEAMHYLEKATRIADSDFHSRGMLTALYLAQGEADRARECGAKMLQHVQAALARDPDNGAALAYGALSFAAVGDAERTQDWIERALLLDPENMYMRYNLAWTVLGFFGDKDQALELLEPALERAGRNLISLAAADRNLDGLRGDARFEAMLEAARDRLGLMPPEASPAAAT